MPYDFELDVVAKYIEDTNQGTPLQVNPYAFPLFGNIYAPLIATFNIPRFTLGLLIWLFSTANVPKALDASQIRTLFQDHSINVSPLFSSPMTYVPLPFSSSVVSVSPSN